MRPLNEIVVHCTATRPAWWATRTVNQKTAEVRRWHVDDRGWSDIGYHYLIDRDGKIATGRPLERKGAHVKGRNTGTVGVALFGGHGGNENDQFSDHFTPAQDVALRGLIRRLQSDYPTIAKISGHHEYAAKACPCFRVGPWWSKDQRAPASKPPTAPRAPVTPQAPKKAPTGFIAVVAAILRKMRGDA